jgi:cysteinyl-tRNA synthetase
VYRFFCLGALYRAKLSFSWDGIDSASTSLNRLRNAVYEWGTAGKDPDAGFMEQFETAINDDLNMPRALAVTWDLVRSNLDASVKKATILVFDKILGLNLADWQPKEEEIPAEVQKLLENRKLARQEKRWADADSIRGEITALGYEVEDTPQGPKVKLRK